MGIRQRPVRAAVLTWAAAVLLGSLLAGCTNSRVGSPAQSSVSGRAILVGRLPGGGRPFTVGAIRDGEIVKTTEVQPGGHFRLAVPPGHYQVGLWIPGAQQTVSYMTCITNTTVKAAHTARTNLQCVWHGSR
jgi:hypothetical protein